MRKKKKNITFKRKNIFIRFFGWEEEDVPILWGEETINVNLFRYFWLWYQYQVEAQLIINWRAYIISSHLFFIYDYGNILWLLCSATHDKYIISYITTHPIIKERYNISYITTHLIIIIKNWLLIINNFFKKILISLPVCASFFPSKWLEL
jgi:hypothetical protein